VAPRSAGGVASPEPDPDFTERWEKRELTDLEIMQLPRSHHDAGRIRDRQSARGSGEDVRPDARRDPVAIKSSSKEELVGRVRAEYRDRALPVILDLAAGAASPE